MSGESAKRQQVYLIGPSQRDQEGLGRSLAQYGYNLVSFVDAKSLDAAPPGPETLCVIIDMDIPDRDGIELLKQLKQKNPTLPVIVTTEASSVSLAVKAMQADAHDFVEKPYTNAFMVNLVKKVTRNRDAGPMTPKLA